MQLEFLVALVVDCSLKLVYTSQSLGSTGFYGHVTVRSLPFPS